MPTEQAESQSATTTQEVAWRLDVPWHVEAKLEVVRAEAVIAVLVVVLVVVALVVRVDGHAVEQHPHAGLVAATLLEYVEMAIRVILVEQRAAQPTEVRIC